MKLCTKLFALAVGLALGSGAFAQTISFTGGSLTQNFDSMGALGTNTPSGWFVASNATAGITYTTNVTVSDGTVANSPAIRGFNFGSSNATDRALGTAPTASNRYIEARIRNNSIFGINAITVTYDGEEWRTGSTTVNTNVLVLQYSSDGTNYVDMGTGFNFTQPTYTPLSAAIDGNNATNRVSPIGGTFTLPAVLVPSGTIFLRWFDFNDAGTDPGLAIDNFSFSATLTNQPVTIAISSPTNGQTFPFSADVPVTTTASGSISNVAFYVDGNFVSTDATTPFTATIPTAMLAEGTHNLQAIATNGVGVTTASAIVSITITPNTPPTISIGNGVTAVLVGTAITNIATLTDDVGVTNVEWFVDGVSRLNRGTPFTFVYNDSLFGTHTISAIATDRGGLTANSGTLTVNVTNPPANFALIITNGADWKYYGNTAEPPVDGSALAWFQSAFNDAGWSNGLAELGNGDTVDGYPEKTLIDIGPAANRYRTIYFRKQFTIANPAQFGNVVLRLLRDDGAVVHLNGQPVWTNNITATGPIVYTNLALSAGDEGTVYQVLNVTSNVLVSGNNTVAVEVHQQSITSSDVSFDMMIWGEIPTLPIVTITSPTNGQSFIETSLVTVNASASTFVTNVTFFVDGGSYASDGTSPFSTIVSNLAAGSHTLMARGLDQYNQTADSPIVTINITPNQPPVIALTNVFNGSNTSHFFLVGTVITNQYGVTDDLGVTNVDFFVDGVLHLRKTNGFGQVLVNDSLAGFHTLTVVASDRLGVTASSSVNVTVTNPPLSLIVTNGSVWKYENSSNDLGTVWRTRAYNDTGWTNSGYGDLGGGNINENNPERTIIDIGVSARIPTIYFRRTFQVSGPISYTNLILNLLRDDGATVYLNDSEIFRSNLITNALFSTFATGTAADDGTVYLQANVNPTNLLVGANVLAVEVHNGSGTSSDLTFDLMLWGEGSPSGPTLTIVNDGNNITVTWPGTGYKLQHSSDLSSPSNWSDVVNNPQNSYQVNLPAPVFFRLAPQ